MLALIAAKEGGFCRLLRRLLSFSYFFALTYNPGLQSRSLIVVPSYAQSDLRIGHEPGIESGTERLNDESVKEETHQRPVAQSSPLIRP